MKLPRDVSGRALIRAMTKLGYRVDRQVGSHVRCVSEGPPRHAITVPDHDPIKPGTLSAIVRDLAEQRGISKAELLEQLDL